MATYNKLDLEQCKSYYDVFLEQDRSLDKLEVYVARVKDAAIFAMMFGEYLVHKYEVLPYIIATTDFYIMPEILGVTFIIENENTANTKRFTLLLINDDISVDKIDKKDIRVIANMTMLTAKLINEDLHEQLVSLLVNDTYKTSSSDITMIDEIYGMESKFLTTIDAYAESDILSQRISSTIVSSMLAIYNDLLDMSMEKLPITTAIAASPDIDENDVPDKYKSTIQKTDIPNFGFGLN